MVFHNKIRIFSKMWLIIPVCTIISLVSVEIRYFFSSFRSAAAPHIARSNCEQVTPSKHNVTGPDVVVFIPTPISWSERRKVVLNQFRRERHLHNAHLLLVLGTKQGQNLEAEAHGLAAARKEAATEEELPHIRYIFTTCRDLGDEPHNPNGTSSTTCKVYEALRHIAAFYDASPPAFVWRGADDAYLDLAIFREHVIPALLPQTCRIFLGRIRFPSPIGDTDMELPVHHPELYSLFGLRKFGKYMVGMGYCMSWDVARFIGSAPIPPRQTWIEDIMVSQWLLFFDVDFIDLNTVVPGVRMVHADEDVALMQSPVAHRVVLAHRMSAGQWKALAQRPVGDQSANYLLAK